MKRLGTSPWVQDDAGSYGTAARRPCLEYGAPDDLPLKKELIKFRQLNERTGSYWKNILLETDFDRLQDQNRMQ